MRLTEDLERIEPAATPPRRRTASKDVVVARNNEGLVQLSLESHTNVGTETRRRGCRGKHEARHPMKTSVPASPQTKPRKRGARHGGSENLSGNPASAPHLPDHRRSHKIWPLQIWTMAASCAPEREPGNEQATRTATELQVAGSTSGRGHLHPGPPPLAVQEATGSEGGWRAACPGRPAPAHHPPDPPRRSPGRHGAAPEKAGGCADGRNARGHRNLA